LKATGAAKPAESCLKLPGSALPLAAKQLAEAGCQHDIAFRAQLSLEESAHAILLSGNHPYKGIAAHKKRDVGVSMALADDLALLVANIDEKGVLVIDNELECTRQILRLIGAETRGKFFDDLVDTDLFVHKIPLGSLQ
jgi:hypothetical protein